MSKNYEQMLGIKFPNLKYQEFKMVDNRKERFAIDDLSFKNPWLKPQFMEVMELFVMACKGYINIFNAQDLARSMNNQLEDSLTRLEPEETILFFPGNGSQFVKTLLPKRVLEYFKAFDISLVRRLATDGSVSNIEVLTKLQNLRKSLPKNLKTCILLDDVIASGSTAIATREAIDSDQKYEWIAASWMMLSPFQVRNRRDDQYKAGLNGFSRVMTPLIYQGENGIPANNSLSSFIETDEKAKTIIERYKVKYVDDQNAFDSAINELRRLRNV